MFDEPTDDVQDEPTEIHAEIPLHDLSSEWQYARVRLARLARNPNLQRELLLVTGMLALVYLAPAISWYRRWTLSPGLQRYALFVIPAVIAWVWIARRRIAVPEVEEIRNVIRLERQSRMMPLEIGEREKTVLQALVNEPPVPDIRSPIFLWCAIVVNMGAFWLRDPTLTCLSFILTCGGIVMFRHGKYAFRTVMFPFMLMFAMIPLPGPLNDAIADRVEPAIMGVVEHMVNNISNVATVSAEGDPLVIVSTTNKYIFYSERGGLCISESLLVLLISVAYLSLIKTSNPFPKLGVLVTTIAACCVLVLARLVLLCWVGMYDKEIAGFLEAITRYLVFALDLGFLFVFVRGFKCVKYHRWVALSLSI